MLQAMVDDIPPVRTPSGRRRCRPGKLDGVADPDGAQQLAGDAFAAVQDPLIAAARTRCPMPS
jgi:hypothetical protein